MKKSIHDVKTWPPGSLMVYKAQETFFNPKKLRMESRTGFTGLGLVVVNDGINTIAVIWGANCKRAYRVYAVDQLNEQVIFHA